MKVFIYATEGMYQGLHGIEDMCVTEINSIHEGNAIGKEMAYDLITSFGLEDEYAMLEDEYAMSQSDYDEESGEFPEWNGEAEELYWNIYEIKDEYKDIETSELDSIACNLGHESFIKEYCGKELSV